MKTKKRCMQCFSDIDLKSDNYVKISTINIKDKPNDHVYFHMNCWTKFFKDLVKQKAKIQVQAMQSKASELFESNESLAKLLSNIKGSDKLLEMLNRPLSPNSFKKENLEIKKNDKPKKRAKKRKVKVQ